VHTVATTSTAAIASPMLSGRPFDDSPRATLRRS
jgi:hypothetical protein